jgi:hypothetical protein
MIEVDRAQVLAYRFDAHGLAPSTPGPVETVLASGVQDYPPGRSAALAIRLRTGRALETSTVLVHSMRGAMHLHRATDLPRLVAALRIEDVQDMPPQAIGPFGAELTEAGITFADALDEVAEAMRLAFTNGGPGWTPTKGELSGTVSPTVRPPLAPWCEGCGVFHIHDKLFRMATLEARLVIMLDTNSPSMFRFHPAKQPPPGTPSAENSGAGANAGTAPHTATVPSADTDPRAVAGADSAASRAELVRAFLAAFGPAKPTHLASWLSITPAAARRWWDRIADELRPIKVDGRRYWTHADHLQALRSPPKPDGIRLLPPYDPLTELADRELLVPDPARRKAVWKTAANPGIVLLNGEIAGVWRQRRTRDRLTLRVDPFTELPNHHRKKAEPDAATIADYFGARDHDLVFE